MSDVDDFLAHYGVPGMKWGKRKSQDSDTKETPRLSRKEVRQLNKEGRQKFYQEKVEKILAESVKKGENVLIESLMYGDTYPTIMTGKQFVDHATSGGLIDVKMTEVFARKQGKEYVLNEDRGHTYQKIKR